MINFFKESVTFDLDAKRVKDWIVRIIQSEEKKEGEINFIFCNDEYLLAINQKFLGHDTYTDIISFDNGMGDELHGDIFISLDRVQDNSVLYKEDWQVELRRVMAHGVLHFCGYKDKTKSDSRLMRRMEDEKLAMFHVEHEK